jgi:NADH-quinone oxidoreductase subunit G
LTEAASRLTALKAAHGADAIAGIANPTMTNEALYLFRLLMRDVIGSGALDHYPRPALPARADLGFRGDIADIDTADVIVLAGTDPIAEVPVLHLRLRKAVQRGAKVVLIHSDPNAFTAKEATTWMQPAPRGEGDVLRVLAAVLDGAEAEEVAGIPPADLTALAEQWVGATKPMLLANPAMLADAATASAVAALQPTAGGPVLSQPNGRGALDLGILPADGGADAAAILGDTGPRGLIVLGGEPPVDRAEALIVFASHLNAAAQQADVVLPIAVPTEEDGTLTNFAGRVQRLRRGPERPGTAEPAWYAVKELARALGTPMPVSSSEQVWDAIQSAVPAYADVTETELNGATPARIQTIEREVAR